MALTQISEKGIKDGEIINADINASAAIARTKLANVDLVDDTSPQLGGALDTNGSNINFGDSTANGTTVNRLTFGTGTNGDLAIWHDGNNSYITDQGTGELRIRGAEVVKIQDSDSAENMGVFNKNGGVELYHNNLKKLDTRADGVAVWGPEGGEAQLRLVADEGDDGADYWRLESNASTNNFNLATYASGAWVDKVTVDSSGNVGIGKTPARKLDIDTSHYVVTSSGQSTTGIHLDGTHGNAGEYGGGISFGCGGDGSAAIAARQASASQHRVGLSFFTHDTTTSTDNAVEKVRLHDSGEVSFNNGICLGNSLTLAAANTMDDYEEGNWTPAVGAGGWTINSTSFAKYVKVASLVTVWCYITFGGTGNSDALLITGLPFTIASDNYSPGSLDVGNGGVKGAYSRTEGHTSGTVAFFYPSENTGSSRIALTGNQVAANYCIFTIQYFTSA